MKTLMLLILTDVSALLIAATITLSSAVARATGPTSTGGGFAAVCRNQNGTIQKAVLADLVDAVVTLKFHLPRPTGDYRLDYEKSARNIYRLQGATLEVDPKASRKNLARFMEISRFTRPGEKIVFKNDMGTSAPLPQGCSYEPAAVFSDNPDHVVISRDIWNAFDSLNRAALITHETHYRWVRDSGERTSQATRAFVAHAYALDKFLPANDGIKPGTATCISPTPNGRIDFNATKFWVFQRNVRGVPVTYLQFSHILGRPLITKSIVEIPNLEWKTQTSIQKIPQGYGLIAIQRDPNRSFVSVFPVRGSHISDLKVAIDYRFNRPVRISLIADKNRTKTQSTFVGCSN